MVTPPTRQGMWAKAANTSQWADVQTKVILTPQRWAFLPLTHISSEPLVPRQASSALVRGRLPSEAFDKEVANKLTAEFQHIQVARC